MTEVPEKILYRIGSEIKDRTTIDYTNTHIQQYIFANGGTSNSRYSQLWFAELCMRRSVAHLNQWIDGYIHCCKANSVDKTLLYEERPQSEYPFWDRKTQIHYVEDADVWNHLLNVETGLANFLFHTNVLAQGVAQLSVDLHRCKPAMWQIFTERVQSTDGKNLLRDISKLLGKEYLLALKCAFIITSAEEKQISKDLGSIAGWRNQRAHRMHFFAYVNKVGDEYEIHFSDSMNDLSHPAQIHFTSADLIRVANRFINFLEWWCWQSELLIGNKKGSWKPKVPSGKDIESRQ